MPVATAMKNHLADWTTYLCHLWKIEERRREILINWETSSRVNVAARGGWLKKNGGTDGSDDAGAFSSHSFAGDGYLKWTTRLTGTVYCGLSTSNGGATAADIDFAIRSDADGTIKVYEGGVLKATMSGTARKGSWLTVKRAGTQITYWHNRTLIYTSAASSSGALFADASIVTRKAVIDQVVFGKNPTVITVSDHTRRLTYNGEVYVPMPINPTRLVQASGLKPDNAEISHVLTASGFTEADLRGGRWDFARVEQITVNYLDLTMDKARRSVGYFGEIKIQNGMFTVELRSLKQLLSQDIGRITSALCDAWRLGNFECGLDITDYMHDTSISSVTNSLTLTIGLGSPKANGYFEYGLIYFRDGNNHFYEREIKNNVGNVLTLHRPFPLSISPGDLVTVIAGCNRTRAKCRLFPNPDNPSGTNIENFQGTPDQPGLQKLLKYPDDESPNLDVPPA
jgi:uncharacterized phage protein (TIGR02218 family)